MHKLCRNSKSSQKEQKRTVFSSMFLRNPGEFSTNITFLCVFRPRQKKFYIQKTIHQKTNKKMRYMQSIHITMISFNDLYGFIDPNYSFMLMYFKCNSLYQVSVVYLRGYTETRDRHITPYYIHQCSTSAEPPQVSSLQVLFHPYKGRKTRGGGRGYKGWNYSICKTHITVKL